MKVMFITYDIEHILNIRLFAFYYHIENRKKDGL